MNVVKLRDQRRARNRHRQLDLFDWDDARHRAAPIPWHILRLCHRHDITPALAAVIAAEIGLRGGE